MQSEDTKHNTTHSDLGLFLGGGGEGRGGGGRGRRGEREGGRGRGRRGEREGGANLLVHCGRVNCVTSETGSPVWTCTHQQYPVEPWHCMGEKLPSALH